MNFCLFVLIFLLYCIFVCFDFFVILYFGCVCVCFFVCVFLLLIYLAHLCRRLVGEFIVYPRSGVCPSSTISNMTISATSGPITMKFYQKRHWVGNKAAIGFKPDRIKTLS